MDDSDAADSTVDVEDWREKTSAFLRKVCRGAFGWFKVW